MKEKNLPISAEQRKQIETEIKSRYKWSSNEYKLELLAEWDNNRLPFIVAIPTERKVDWSPKYVILPDGKLISPTEPNSYNRIIELILPSITTVDAKFLAEITLMFGAFGKPVGSLWTNSVDRPDFGKVPRKGPMPTITINKGEIVFKFYSYDHELMKMHDCEVKIKGKEIKFNVKRLN